MKASRLNSLDGPTPGFFKAPDFFKAIISGNIPLNENHSLITLEPSVETSMPLAGQFYMIGPTNSKGSRDPLLKRPFSCLSWEDGRIKMLYRIRGRATSLMKGLLAGSPLEIIGPLGNHYPPAPPGKTPLVVAGGVGIASLYSFIAESKGRAVVLYGGRNGNELLMLDELRGLAKELHVSTEDGSAGKKGLVTGLFGDIGGDGYIIYACGPKGMLKAVSEYAAQNGIKGYISLEERMACGVGACLGCAAKTKTGYRRVCKEGPVFDMEEIVF